MGIYDSKEARVFLTSMLEHSAQQCVQPQQKQASAAEAVPLLHDTLMASKRILETLVATAGLKAEVSLQDQVKQR
jgi:hypothetical protein